MVEGQRSDAAGVVCLEEIGKDCRDSVAGGGFDSRGGRRDRQEKVRKEGRKTDRLDQLGGLVWVSGRVLGRVSLRLD